MLIVHFFTTGCCRAPPDPSRPQDRATPDPHDSTRCNRRKRRAGGVERSPPGDCLLGPWERSVPRGGRGFQHWRCSPAGVFFCVPCCGFQLYGRRIFPGMEHYNSPSGVFFRIPVFLAQRRASDSVHTGRQWFEPRLLSSFFLLFCMSFFPFFFHYVESFFRFFETVPWYYIPPGIFSCVPVLSFFLYITIFIYNSVLCVPGLFLYLLSCLLLYQYSVGVIISVEQ